MLYNRTWEFNRQLPLNHTSDEIKKVKICPWHCYCNTYRVGRFPFSAGDRPFTQSIHCDAISCSKGTGRCVFVPSRLFFIWENKYLCKYFPTTLNFNWKSQFYFIIMTSSIRYFSLNIGQLFTKKYIIVK